MFKMFHILQQHISLNLQAISKGIFSSETNKKLIMANVQNEEMQKLYNSENEPVQIKQEFGGYDNDADEDGYKTEYCRCVRR